MASFMKFERGDKEMMSPLKSFCVNSNCSEREATLTRETRNEHSHCLKANGRRKSEELKTVLATFSADSVPTPDVLRQMRSLVSVSNNRSICINSLPLLKLKNIL